MSWRSPSATLRAGEMLDGEGGYTVWGKLVPAERSLAEGALPIGLAHSVPLKRDVAAGAVVRWADVDVPDSEAVRVRREMERRFYAAARHRRAISRRRRGMEYRLLRPDRHRGFGNRLWVLGGWRHLRADRSRRIHSAVHQAIDSGITCFDTAEAYGMGVSEEALGEALGARRSQVSIVTKFGTGYVEVPNRRDSSRGRVLASIDQSLRRLRTDYVDAYLVHWPDPATPLDETIRALDDIVRQGKARYIGVSNFRLAQIEECMRLRRMTRASIRS